MGIFILLSYFILMIGATIYFTKRETTAESFHVGNRHMGVFRSAMGIAATWIWAPALFVSAEKAYTGGIPGLFWFLIPNLLCLILFIPFAKLIRRQMPKGITLSGYMAAQYQSRPVRNVYLTQLVGLGVLSTAVQLLAGGKIFSSLMGMDFTTVTILLAVGVFSYIQFSGFRASIMTDVLQMVFILLACAVFVPWALIGGGMDSLTAGLGGISGHYDSLFSGPGLEVFLAFGVPTAIGLISGPFGDQAFWQRAFAIDEKKITKSFVWGAVLFGIVPFSMGILGFIAAGSGFIPQDSGIVNLELITHLFPAWVVWPFLFMLLSGLLSTVDSNLCAVASLTTDVTDSQAIWIPKAAMVALLIAGILIAHLPGLSIVHLFLIYGTLRATTLLPTVLTLSGVKLSARGIYIGVIAAMVVGLPTFAFGVFYEVTICRILGCIITPILTGVMAFGIDRRGKNADNKA